MNTTNTTNATQSATTAQEYTRLSAFSSLLDTSVFETNEDGETNRPNVDVFCTLSHETEDYMRIIKTLWKMLAAYRSSLVGTYGAGTKADERFKEVLPVFQQLRTEVARDLGECIAERLSEWGEDYM